MNNNIELTLRLRNAEAAFSRSAIQEAGTEATWNEEQGHIARLRHHCRKMSSALAEHATTGASASFEDARDHCREMRLACLALSPASAIPFHCLDQSCLLLRRPRKTCWISLIESSAFTFGKNDPVQKQVGSVASLQSDHAAKSFFNQTEIIGPAGLERRREAPSILRQGLNLLALISAYLVYYFADVQLQIVSLPLAIAWLAH